MTMGPVILTSYERSDLEWWCLHHKQTLSLVCVRLRQYMDMGTDTERAKLEPILDVLLENLNEKGIGIIRNYEEE